MSGSLGAIDHDVAFDFDTSDALIAAFNAAATEIDGQAPARASYVATAEQDFSGYFAQLFAQNAATAAGDGADLVVALKQTATFAGELAQQAWAENQRRELARNYMAGRHANWAVDVGEWLMGDNDEQPPVGPPDEPLTKPVEAPRNRERQQLVGSGACGGVSSARPENLTTFATGSARLNGDLSGLDVSLRSHLDDFTTRCTYGTLSADDVVTSLSKWLAANDKDVQWATTVAASFAAAGGTGGVDTLSNATLEAALAAAGVSQVRADLDIAMPSAMGGAPTNGYTMDPVNTATGNFVEPEVDLAFTGGAATLALTRMYNSVDTRVGVFGPGWSSILEVALDLDVEGARWRMADGRGVFFPRHDTGWERGAGENYWLTRENTGSATLAELGLSLDEVLMVRDNAGAWWAFTPSGRWLGSGHGPGTTITVRRDGEGRVVGLSHQRGRSLDVTYADGRVALVTACDGRTVNYCYDDAGHLTGVVTAAGIRSYRWNDAGRIQAVISPAGVVEAANTYDAHGRVMVQTSPFGRQVHFTYLPGPITQVSDADGTRSNTWLADTKGRVIGVIDSAGNRQSMAWDHWGNLVTVTERDQAATVHSYDQRGRRARTILPTRATITYTHDDLDRITTETTTAAPAAAVASTQATSESDRGAESTISYEYATDADRDPHLIIDALGGRTELTWSGGLLTRVVDPTGVAVDLDYDTHGDLIAATNAAGDTMRITRDEAGRIVQVTTPAGHVTCYTYDQAGNLSSRTDPDGATWGFEHTVAGQLSVIIDPTGARTELQYGPHGQLVRTIDPLGRSIERVFDDLGNLATVHLPDGATWTYTHDALSRLTAITDPAGGTWSRQYGPGGDLWATIDPTGVRHSQTLDRQDGTARLTNAFATTTIQFDKLGHLIQTHAPDGSVEQVTYDPCGNPIELLDGEGGQTILGRDAAGRIVSITTPTGAVSRIAYDTCGRPRTLTDPLGATTTLTYDADSHLIARTFPTGEVETFTYDPCGRLTSHVIPGGGIARYRYDKAGRITTIRDTWNGTRHFTYDAAGQLTATVNGLDGRTVYDYDTRGRLIQVTDPLGAITTHTHNPLGQIATTTDPLGRTTTYGYDGAGRLTDRTDPEGHTTTWTYDRAGLPESVVVDGRIISTTTRDPKTRRITVADHAEPNYGREHVLEFNRRGQLTRRSRDDQALHWEYDADGNRTAFTSPDGTRTTYTHDAAGHLTAIDNPLLGHAAFSYDPAGRLTRAQTGETSQTWTYADGYLAEHVTNVLGRPDVSRIQHHPDGQIAAVFRSEATTAYEYDPAGQLTAAITRADETASTRRWVYDQAGHLTEEQTPAGTRHLHYDVASQLTRIDEVDGTWTTFTYDGLGRRTRAESSDGVQAVYVWGPLGYLSNLTTETPGESGSDHRFAVDALGELSALDHTDLWWDTAAPLPTLAAIGTTQVLPLAGLTGIGRTWATAGWRTQRAAATDDPWAVATVPPAVSCTHQGADPQSLPSSSGIALSQTGGLNLAGLEWLGARVCDPASRAFLATDPLPPMVGAAWAANPYAYAGNNPLALLDPTGLRPATDQDLKNWADSHQSHWEDVLGVLAIAGGVATMFIPGINMVAAGAIAGALGSGGLSVLSQKSQTGSVNWTSALENAVVGAAVGAASGGAALWGKTVMAAAPARQAFAAAVTSMSVNSLVSGATSAATYLIANGGHVQSVWDLAGAVAGGAVGGAIGSLVEPAGGTIAEQLGTSSIDWLSKNSSILTKASTMAMSGASSAAGSLTRDAVSGSDPNYSNALADAAISGATDRLPTDKLPWSRQNGLTTLQQMPYFAPRTVHGAFDFSKANTRGMWGIAANGAVIGGGADLLQSFLGS